MLQSGTNWLTKGGDDFLALELYGNLTGEDNLLAQQKQLDEYLRMLRTNASALDPTPRTSQIPYNVLRAGEKYFVYSPSGGLGNQIVELIYACVISTRFKRTLIVPMLGSHTTMWYRYERLPDSGRFPMDRIIDFPQLQKLCKVVPLNTTVLDCVAKARLRNKYDVFEIYHTERRDWRISNLERAIKPRQRARIVYFHGAGFYTPWTPKETFEHALQFVRFSPFLRLRALEIVRQAFPPEGKFNALHIRLGDYTKRWDPDLEKRKQDVVAIPNRFPLRNRTLPMYLATDEPNGDSLALLKQKYNISTIFNLPQQLMGEYAKMFPEEFQLDMQGVLDQLVCSQAEDFIPIVWSSFSQGITKIRKHRTTLFPESLKP